MENNTLKRTIIQVVNNQIRMNDPKCTSIAFERLVASGYSEKEAKDLIGAVLLEDIFYILHDKQNFDEEKYAGKLNRLPGKHEMESEAEGQPDLIDSCFNKDENHRCHNEFEPDSFSEKQISMQTVVKEFKTGRNDPCPCGSGKKYKKCCGK